MKIRVVSTPSESFIAILLALTSTNKTTDYRVGPVLPFHAQYVTLSLLKILSP